MPRSISTGCATALRQRVEAPAVADVEFCEIILPLGERLLAKLRAEENRSRLLVWTRTAQAQFGKLGAAKAPSRLWMNFGSCPASTR